MEPLTAEERKQAFSNAKKDEVIRKQRLPVRYHVEDFEVRDRPRRFLEAFAAILKHTNYRLALDHYVRVSAKCARCATMPGLPGDRRQQGHPLLSFGTAAVGLSPAFHGVRHSARADSGRSRPDRRQDPGDGGRRSTTARPAAAATSSARWDRPRPGYSPRPLHPVGNRNRPRARWR